MKKCNQQLTKVQRRKEEAFASLRPSILSPKFIFPLCALVPLWFSLILSCAPGTQSLKTSMPKLKVDPKSIVEIPSYLDLAKLKVIYEDGELIKWIDEKGRTNISYEPAKYLPKPVKLDEDKFCQVYGYEKNVYEWPLTSGTVVDHIGSNELITVVEEYKYFTKVNTPRNIEGWIERTDMQNYSLKKTANNDYIVTIENGNLVVKSKDGKVIKRVSAEENITKNVSGVTDVKSICDAYDPFIYLTAKDKILGVMQGNKISSVSLGIHRTPTKGRRTYYYNIEMKLLDTQKRDVYRDLFAGVARASDENVFSVDGSITGMSSYEYKGYTYNMATVELSGLPPNWDTTAGAPLPWCQIYREGMLMFAGQDSSEFQYSYIPNLQMVSITHDIGAHEIVGSLYDPIAKRYIIAVTNNLQMSVYFQIHCDKFGNVLIIEVTSKTNKYGGRIIESEKTNILYNIYSKGIR